MTAFAAQFSPLFATPLTGGFGFGMPVVTDESSAVPDKPVKPAEAVKRSIGGGLGYSFFPGFGLAPRRPTVADLWAMRNFPDVRVVHSRVTEPVRSGVQTFEVVDLGAGPDVTRQVQDAGNADLLPILKRAVAGAMEAICFGNWLQEVIYGKRDGRTVPLDVRSVVPGEGELLVDAYRNFTGFRVNGQYRDARYAYLVVNEPHLDPVLGHTPNVGALIDWWRSIESAKNADAVERKPTLRQLILEIAEGDVSVDEDGNIVADDEIGRRWMAAFMRGECVVAPKWAFDKDSVRGNPGLAEVSKISHTLIDFGDVGPALEAHLNRLEKLAANIAKAWGLPPLSVQESSKGGIGQGNTEAHSNVVLCISERLHEQAVSQWDAQVTARWFAANFAGAKVRVRTIPAPLADPEQTYRQAVFTARITATAVDPSIDSNVDWRKLAEQTELPLRSVEDAADVLAKSQADAAAKAAQAQQQAVALAKAKGPVAPGEDEPEGAARAEPADRADAAVKGQA